MNNLEVNLLTLQDLVLTQTIDPTDFYAINLHYDIRCQGKFSPPVVDKYTKLGFKLSGIDGGFVRLFKDDVVLVFA